MRGVVLAAWAVLALLRGERPAGEVVRRYVRRTAGGRFEVLLNVINLGEVLYRLIQVEGRTKATERFARFRRGPVIVVPARESLVLEAAELKAGHALSYADAFAVATARKAALPVLTGDPEILALPTSVVRVRRVVRHR
jgi:ribonuclease VapC